MSDCKISLWREEGAHPQPEGRNSPAPQPQSALEAAERIGRDPVHWKKQGEEGHEKMECVLGGGKNPIIIIIERNISPRIKKGRREREKNDPLLLLYAPCGVHDDRAEVRRSYRKDSARCTTAAMTRRRG